MAICRGNNPQKSRVRSVALAEAKIRKIPLKSTISEGFWSEWGDSNARSLEPKSSAIPASLHPDIQFPPLYHGEGKNQRFFCLWSNMWSKQLLCRFRQSGEIPQTQVSQSFATFHIAPSRIPPRHSQMRRDTNFATPGYLALWGGESLCGAVCAGDAACKATVWSIDSADGVCMGRCVRETPPAG